MSQQVPPLLPADATAIGPLAALVENADGGVVFVSGQATFAFAAGDEVGRRLAAVQLVDTKIASLVATGPATASFSGPAPYWQSYTYDLTGNRLSTTDHPVTGGAPATSTTTETYTGLSTQHAVHTVTTATTATTRSYDPDGRPTGSTTTVNGTADTSKTQTLTWTPGGHLSTATLGPTAMPNHSISYTYDPAGNLAARTNDGNTTIYLGNDTITLNPTGTTTKIVRQHRQHLGQRPRIRRRHDRHHHRLDQPRRPRIQGRFLNPDPLLDTTDPQSWNGYAYADNNPIIASDPTGTIIGGCRTIDGSGVCGSQLKTTTGQTGVSHF